MISDLQILVTNIQKTILAIFRHQSEVEFESRKLNQMKNIGSQLFILLLVILISACSNNALESKLEKIQFSADSLKQSLIPDSRIGLAEYSFNIKNDSILIKGKTENIEFKNKLLSILNENQIDLIDSLNQLPDPGLNGYNWALINVSVANLRSQPGHSKEMATQAILGTPVKVLEQEGEWYRIQTPDKYLAWAESASLHLMTEIDLLNWKQSDRVIFMNDYGVIRSTKENDSPAVSDIVLGAILETANSSGKFIEVVLPNKRTGYLAKNELIDFSSWIKGIEPDAEKFIDLGYNMLGRPYLWGGTSTKGIDCSGFVKTLYFSGGLILNRDASQQVNQGDLVDTDDGFDQLEPGDLLFFGRKKTDSKKERITHVGMYVNNGTYIHSSGMVKLNSFNAKSEIYSKYLEDIFVRAKRIIASETNHYPVSVSSHPWYN